MEVHQGSTRFTVIVCGFAVKFPKIMIWECLKDTSCLLKSIELKSYLTRDSCLSDSPGLKYKLFCGLISNWNEFLFWHKYKNNFCEPTYFSLLGLVNIARASSSYSQFDKKVFWQEMRKVDGYDRGDGHHFSNPKNFSIRNGKILIVDYASRETQRVILEYGQNIIKHFSNL